MRSRASEAEVAADASGRCGAIHYDVIESPIGSIFVGGSAAGLHWIDFMADARDAGRLVERLARDAAEGGAREAGAAGETVGEATRQLRAYFRGERTTFDLPLAPRGTAFQQRVWEALRAIPPGETATYGAIAARLGQPAASRAVGAANGRNPLAIVVQCHRVIGADGALTGYAGGLHRKRWLLAHEGAALSTLRGSDVTVA